jgi:hypothetical protein
VISLLWRRRRRRRRHVGPLHGSGNEFESQERTTQKGERERER